MLEKDFSLQDAIAALATPWGKSALAVIRLSGNYLFINLKKVLRFKSSISKPVSRKLYLAEFIEPESKKVIDELMCVFFYKPASYTGEDMAELYCHGGLPTILNILKTLRMLGIREAKPGEFSLRAFLNGKIDLTQAEAVQEVVSAQSERARELALMRLNGALYNKINALKEDLTNLLAEIEVVLDYPEETDEHQFRAEPVLKSCLTDLEKLLATYQAGKIYQEGAVVALAGLTNSGKSTLFNLLLKEERSIVSEIPGTTRDYIEGLICIRGIPLKIYDTAGLRYTKDMLEEEGIKRTRKIIEGASLILYLVDACQGLSELDKQILNNDLACKKVICLWNKIDLNSSTHPPGFIPIVANNGEGLLALEEEIYKSLVGDFPQAGETLAIDSERHFEALLSAKNSIESALTTLVNNNSYDLLAEDIREALNFMASLTGEVTSSDVLHRIFSKFCVGK